MACFNFRVTFKCLDSFNAELNITGPCGSGKLSIINQECCCEHSYTSNCIRIFHKTKYLPIINWDVYSDGFGAFNKTAKPLKCSSLFYTTDCGSSIYNPGPNISCHFPDFVPRDKIHIIVWNLEAGKFNRENYCVWLRAFSPEHHKNKKNDNIQDQDTYNLFSYLCKAS